MPASVRSDGSGSLKLATRGSPLALAQARSVADRLAARLAETGSAGVELLVVSTRGDRHTDVPVHQMGGQGAFVKEVQAAVLAGDADIAVHSAKDLPASTPEGLVLACVPERADPRDALVGSTLESLPVGATIATGSVRRRAQLAWLRPDLTFAELRGNMARRLDEARRHGAGVVAMAALLRLGLGNEADEVLETATMLPQVGQGALAVECRSADAPMRELLAGIDDEDAHRALRAERAFLAALGGGCTLPVGALAVPAAHRPTIALEGLLASRDGHVVLRCGLEGGDPEDLGAELAVQLLEHSGGRSLDDWSVA